MKYRIAAPTICGAGCCCAERSSAFIRVYLLATEIVGRCPPGTEHMEASCSVRRRDQMNGLVRLPQGAHIYSQTRDDSIKTSRHRMLTFYKPGNLKLFVDTIMLATVRML